MAVTPIVRGEGTTRSERILAKLGEASFLNLWTYPSPYRDKKLRGEGDGKELCDLLVVCGDDVIIFSDKEICWTDHADTQVAWGRWYRTAVQESAKQIAGAESWIRRNPNRVFLDKDCTSRLPIRFPSPERMRLHGVVIATGAEKACETFTGNRNGRLCTDSSIKGAEHWSPLEASRPFAIGDPNPNGSFIHVFDRPGMVSVLTLIDTMSDFVRYLQKREEVIRGERLVWAFGEDDMVAHYISGVGADGDHDFIRADFPHKFGLDDGIAEVIKRNPIFQQKLRDDRTSYVWDGLIQQFTTHLLAGTNVFPDGMSFSNHEIEEAVRLMALESRVLRRQLGQRVIDAYENLERSGSDRAASVFLPPKGDKRTNGYVFIVLAFRPSFFDNYKEYKRFRMVVAATYARALLAENRFLTSVIAISVDAPEHVTGVRGGSEDLMMHLQIDWSEAELSQLRQQRDALEILPNYQGGGRVMRVNEYRDGESRQQRRARERRERKARQSR